MNGPAGLLKEYGVLGLFEVEKVTAADKDGLDTLLTQTVPQREKESARYQEACDKYSDLGQTIRDLTLKHAQVNTDLVQKRMSYMNETIQNSTAADTRAFAASQLPLECEVTFIADTVDLLRYVHFPAATDRKLEALRDLRRVEALELGIMAGLDHARNMERLERAGVFDGGNRVGFISEGTERLRSAAKEAHRLAEDAESALNAERARHLTVTQQRHANGGVTRAEAVHTSFELSRSTN